MLNTSSMKKQIFGLLSALLLVLLAASCSSDPDSYENLLSDEKDLISSYISRNGINVVSTLPADGAWGPNDYYLTPNGVYVHIVESGDVNSTPVYSGQLVIARYYQMTLAAVPDTVFRLWTTIESPYPFEFKYANTSEASVGFHEAVKYMKYDGASAKLIVPSKQGTSADANSVIPYAYDLKIKLGD